MVDPAPLAEARRQLDAIQANADEVCTALAQGASPADVTRAITRASAAVDSFETIIRSLQPLIDQAISTEPPNEATLDAMWRASGPKRAPRSGEVHRPIAVPPPAISLQEIIDRVQRHLDVEVATHLRDSPDHEASSLALRCGDAFIADVVLSPDPGGVEAVDVAIRDARSTCMASSSNTLFHRHVNTAAIAALFHFASTTAAEVAPPNCLALEKLLLWLVIAGTTLSATSAFSKSPASGGLILSALPPYKGVTRDHLWTRALQLAGMHRGGNRPSDWK